ncbi:MAG: energy transducer TonB [Deltaproteobacteria bacterium]|jgi:protein TonB|nr:energy transducer TonB [Deltaproteobacteria bacterium]
MDAIYLDYHRAYFWRAMCMAAALHLSALAVMLLPAIPKAPIAVLAVMDFAHYDPLGGEPGPLAPPPEPEPEPEPEIPDEPPPQLLESVAEKAEVAPPPPEIKEKPKEKPKKKPKPPKAEVAQGAAGEGLEGAGPPGPGQGGVGGGVGRGNPSALAAYQAKIRTRLEKNKKYPPQARQNRVEGIVMARFTINKEGQVVGGQIVKSSGHNVLDDEVLGLLRRVNPFPPIPKELGDKPLTITAPIQFKVR